MPRLPLAHLLPAGVLGLAMALASGAAVPALAQGTVPGFPAAAPAANVHRHALDKAAATAAAQRILRALRDGDANTRYAQFAPRLKRVSSPALVQAALKTRPRLLSWTITDVEPGLDSTTVTAQLLTAAGSRQMIMSLDPEGLLEAYHVDASNEPAEKVVDSFMKALTSGQYILASSYLGATLQKEIPQDRLQAKWLDLQRITGNFQRVRSISSAEQTADMKLVIVSAQFNRLTDNLFVTLDGSNRIIGVDFPMDPAAPTPAR
jgi:hypothetical protein